MNKSNGLNLLIIILTILLVLVPLKHAFNITLNNLSTPPIKSKFDTKIALKYIEMPPLPTDTSITISTTETAIENEFQLKEHAIVDRGRITKRTAENLSDLELLSRVIFAESDGTEEDALLVGNVVMNRLESDKFPNTLHEVIFAQNQYACTWDGNYNKQPSELAIQCAQRLLNGERFCPSNVVWQAQFKQGDGVWKKVGVHYYCYSNY